MALAIFSSLILMACATTQSPNNSPSLGGTHWILSSLQNQSLLPDRPITLHFDNNTAYWTDGCNRNHTSYTTLAGNFKVGENAVSTLMGCPEPVMKRAIAINRMFREANRYRQDNQALFLLDTNGNELAAFKAQSNDLAGTSWSVTGYNNGKQAVVSIMLGSEISVVFNRDGTLGGSTGCNNYHISYESSYPRIKMGLAAATFKYCAAPDGVMAQETQFLKALESATTYSVDGDQLQLRTIDNALAVMMTSTLTGNAIAP
jgi:heat shock protein HslJ